MSDGLSPELEELVERARVARERAYAPYSKYCVGASVRTASGALFAGCNVENASYGATACAERNAIAAMVQGGERRAIAVAVFTEGPTPAMPCGICRQVLWELGSADTVVVAACPGAVRVTTLGALLPEAFELER